MYFQNLKNLSLFFSFIQPWQCPGKGGITFNHLFNFSPNNKRDSSGSPAMTLRTLSHVCDHLPAFSCSGKDRSCTLGRVCCTVRVRRGQENEGYDEDAVVFGGKKGKKCNICLFPH